MRPQPWSPQALRTLWLDFGTGYGVTETGAPAKARIGGRRQKPNLLDYLETAAFMGAERIMFTGKLPEAIPGKPHWLMAKSDGWTGLQIHTRSSSATYEHQATGHKVYLRTASEWFGDVRLSPAQGRECWDILANALKGVEEKATMFLAPSPTGRNLWALSLPRDVDPQPLTDDIAEEIHKTSGQHHIDHLVAGANFSHHEDCIPLVTADATPTIDEFAYVDGRFMYAKLCNELGIGPGRRLKRAEAFEMLEDRPFSRARVLVRFRVPDDWNHIGLLGVQHADVADGWYYPNRPGATGETWVDMSEASLARSRGWLIDPLEAVEFTQQTYSGKVQKDVKTKPLDTFADRLMRARARVLDNPNIPDRPHRKAIAAALRAIMLQSIGAFASRGPDHQVKVASARDIPVEYQQSAERWGTEYIYTVPGRLTDRTRPFYHPELAAQVWGRGRAKILDAPAAGGGRVGALHVDPSTLLGINGDAIYTTSLPRWALPQGQGGGDDGKPGRLRLQGYLAQDGMKVPTTIAARDQLKKKSENALAAGAFGDDEEVA